MIEFVEKPEEETDPFEQYYTDNIIPLVEEENKVKARYRSKFWGYLFSVLFLMSANVLIVLFNSLMHKTPISWSQLVLINVIALSFVYLPIYRYNKMSKNDIFDVFLKFYGNWQHLKNSEVKLVHSSIIPEHDAVGSTHNVRGNFGDKIMEIRDTYYTKKNKVVSQGVILYATFDKKFKGSLLMFEKGGFYRKNKFPNLYLQAEDNYMRIYLEGSSLYIDNYKIWSRKIDKNRFLQMHNEFEKIALFMQTIQSLMDEK